MDDTQLVLTTHPHQSVLLLLLLKPLLAHHLHHHSLLQDQSEAHGSIKLYTPQYYAACALGGGIAGGFTNSLVCPLDLVKCRRQVFPNLYKNTWQLLSLILKNEGLTGVYTSYTLVLLGYGIQGAAKYGLYEYFKKSYTDSLGEDTLVRHSTLIYLASGASAEFILDILYCPVELVKVRMQLTMPTFATGPFDGLRKIIKLEGFSSLYRGLIPLWSRQLPFTMTKFALFENVVSKIYETLPREKEDYSPIQQTLVSYLAGYIAGIACAVVSHPADVMFSKINSINRSSESQTNMGISKLVSQIYKDIGFRGLWNGLSVRIVMVGTLTGLQWLVYDAFKLTIGLPTTGH